MEQNNEKDNKLILSENNVFNKLQETLNLTNILIIDNKEKLFNKAFELLLSEEVREDDINYYKQYAHNITVLSLKNYRFWKSEESKEIINILNYLISVENNNPVYYFLRGVAKFFVDGEEDNSLSDLNISISINEKFSFSFYFRARIYVLLKEYEKALEDYNKAIALRSDFYIYFYRRGLCFVELKDKKSAISDFSTTIQLKPDFIGAYEERILLWKDTEFWFPEILFDADVINSKGENSFYLEKYDILRRLCLHNDAIDFILRTMSDFLSYGSNEEEITVIKFGIYSQLIDNYCKIYDFDLALKYFNEAVSLNFSNKKFDIFSLFNDIIKDGEKEKAETLEKIKKIDFQISKNDAKPISYFDRYLLKRGIGDYDGALSDLNEYYLKTGKEHDLFYKENAVDLYFYLKNYNKAQNFFNEINYKKNASNIKNIKLRASCKFALKDYVGYKKDILIIKKIYAKHKL